MSVYELWSCLINWINLWGDTKKNYFSHTHTQTFLWKQSLQTLLQTLQSNNFYNRYAPFIWRSFSRIKMKQAKIFVAISRVAQPINSGKPWRLDTDLKKKTYLKKSTQSSRNKSMPSRPSLVSTLIWNDLYSKKSISTSYLNYPFFKLCYIYICLAEKYISEFLYEKKSIFFFLGSMFTPMYLWGTRTEC